MAAIWTVKIDVLDADTKTVRVTGTRADGADITTHTCEGTYDNVNKTPAKLLAEFRDVLWGLYQDSAVRDAKIAAIVLTGETALANALNAKEI